MSRTTLGGESVGGYRGEDIAVYVGPNRHARVPVIHLRLDVGTDGDVQQRVEDLAVELQRSISGFEFACACMPDRSSGFGDSASDRSLGHLMEHICISLQNLAGAELECVRSCDNRLDSNEAVIPYEDREVCIRAAGWARDLMVERAGKAGVNTPPIDVAARTEEFLNFAAREMLPVQDRELIRAARASDIPVTVLAGRILVLGQGRFQQRVSGTKTSQTNIIGNDLAANKDYARRVLGDMGLPVPQYERVYSRRGAVEAAQRIGYPVVIKPNYGSMGRAVSVGVENRREAREAYDRARQVGRSVLVEEVVDGADYRILVIGGKFRAAAQRVPAHVVGDGKRSIKQLVDEVNSDPRRGVGNRASMTLIEIDGQAERLLQRLGFTADSVAAAGEVVYLRRNANTSDGGTAVDVTDNVHPDNRIIAERAAKAIGLDVAGVDFLTRDIATSMWNNGGKICEINSRPGIRKHIWPSVGQSRDVLTPMLEMLFAPGNRCRISTVAVMGSGPTGLVTDMLAHILRAKGREVRVVANGCVGAPDRAVRDPGLTLPEATRRVLLDPDVDAAVFGLDAGSVLREGLGCDIFDVTIIVNNPAAAPESSETHSASRLRDAIRVVAGVTRGAVVVCDSDPYARMLESRWNAAPLRRIGGLETVADRAPGAQAREGDASRARASFEGEELVIPRAELLASVPGYRSSEIVRSAIFAGAAAASIGTDQAAIAAQLRSFSPTPTTNEVRALSAR